MEGPDKSTMVVWHHRAGSGNDGHCLNASAPLAPTLAPPR
jgi:hypothetical protein